MKKLFLSTALLTALLSSCNPDKSSNSDQKEHIDSILDQNTLINGVETAIDNDVIQFWENFNFDDPLLATSANYGEQHFVDFINLFPQSNRSNIAKGINSLLKKAGHNKKVLSYFEELFSKYLYDVNSPFYNEDFYIIALEQLLHSHNITDSNKTKYRIRLKIANKNREGDVATDFSFYSKNKTISLLEIDSDYVILFFYIPGCQQCEDHIRILKTHSDFNHYLSNKTTMLALYADGNKEIWENYADNIPNNWINGIDLKQDILRKGLYDLKASPTIYLLDKEKRVLLKDTNLKDLLDYLKNHIK